MKIKKLIAGLAASAMAVSVMAVSSSAADYSKVSKFNIWIAAATNVDGDTTAIWDGPGSGTNCETDKIAVDGSGEYTVTLTMADGAKWVFGDNNFMMVGSDIDVDAWKALGADGTGDTGLLSITKVTADGKELEMTNTSLTMDDSGIRVNVYNPWGGDDTHAVPSMEGLDGASEIKVTVKVTIPTDEPATDEPTTDEPTTDEPTTDEPADEPETQAPDNAGNTGLAGIALIGVALSGASVVAAKKRK